MPPTDERFQVTLGSPGVTPKSAGSTQGDVRLTAPSNDAQVESDLALVRLSGLTMRRLLSGEHRDGPDNLKKREGTIAFSFNGQETSLSWATDGQGHLKNREKFANHMLFFGKHNHNLDLEVQIIETDEETVKALKRGKSMLTVASRLGALIPGAGMLVSAVTNLVGAIVDVIRGNADDDLELSFHGSVGDFVVDVDSEDSDEALLCSGEYVIVRSQGNESGQPDIEVRFEVHPFTEIDNSSSPEQTKVAVALTGMQLDLTPDMNDFHLQFDASMGSGKHVQKTSIKAPIKNGDAGIENVMGLKNRILYKGPWTVGVPFYFSLAGVRNNDELEVIEGLIDEAGHLGVATAETKEETIRTATKAAQSVRAAVIEFLPRKISVGNMSGMIAAQGSFDDELGALRNFSSVASLTKTWQELSPLVLESATRRNKARLKLAIKEIA